MYPVTAVVVSCGELSNFISCGEPGGRALLVGRDFGCKADLATVMCVVEEGEQPPDQVKLWYRPKKKNSKHKKLNREVT